MRRIFTTTLGAFLVAGVLYRPPLGTVTSTTRRALSSAPTGGVGATPLVAGQPPGKHGVQPIGGPSNNPCEEIGGPWEKLSKYLGNDEQEGKGDPFAGLSAKQGEYSFSYLIATLPDPVHTRLALVFDSSVDAIARAAAESGYNFDRQWLPWDAELPPAEPDCYWRLMRERATESKELEPGLLIFRKAKDQEPKGLLLVFLVGEAPTAGINKTQFSNAVRHIRSLPPGNSPDIPVLGPTFSGSVDSLLVAMRNARKKSAATFQVSSGSITGKDSICRLKDACWSRSDSSGCSEAGTTLADDSEAVDKLRAYLHTRGEDIQVALISEDGTEYGQEVIRGTSQGQDEAAWLALHFPRNISRLREAYQNIPELQMSRTAPEASLPRRLLPLVLKESPAVEQDSVPIMSREQTPLEQESELLSVAGTLKNKGIRYTGLFASDPLDTMFLIRFLRKSNPDVRLILFDTDLLYLRSLDETAPVGLMAVTSYPLFPESQGWMAPTNPEHPLIFPNQISEAMYNACLLLLRNPRALRDVPSGALGQAALTKPSPVANPQGNIPREGSLDLKPPLWLVTVGHGGYWPVCLLEVRDLIPPNLAAPGLWMVTWALLSLLIFLFFLLLVVAQWSDNPRLSILVITKVEPASHRVARAFYVLVVTISLLGVLVVLVFPALGITELGRMDGLITLFDFAFLIVATMLLAAWELPPWPGGQLAKKRAKWILLLLCAYYGFVVTQAFPTHRISSLAKTIEFVNFANVEFLIGTLIVLVGWYIWSASKGNAPEGSLAKRASSFARSISKRRKPEGMLGKHAWFFFCSMMLLVGCLWFCYSWWTARDSERCGFWFYYRSLHLLSGASPSVPVALLFGAFIAWGWMNVDRMELAVRLPGLVKTGMHSNVSRAARRLRGGLYKLFFDRIGSLAVSAGIVLGILVFQLWKHVSTFEPVPFDAIYLVLLSVIIWTLFTSCARFLYVWIQLRTVLEGMNHLPMEEAFKRLPRQYSWSFIFEYGGARQSHDVLMRTIDCLKKLVLLTGWQDLEQRRKEISEAFSSMVNRQPLAETGAPATPSHLLVRLRQAAELIIRRYLLEEWAKGGSDSLNKEAATALTPRSREKDFREGSTRIIAEEFVALRHLAYIRHVCLHLRHILGFLSTGFILTLLSIKSYPFHSPAAINWGIIVVFVVLSLGVLKVLVEMEKDYILSALADTQAGKLSADFFIRVVSYGALPLFTVIASQFPSVAQFLFSWVQPGLQALK